MNRKLLIFIIIVILVVVFINASPFFGSTAEYSIEDVKTFLKKEKVPTLDVALYDAKLIENANNPILVVPPPKLDKDGKEIPPPPPKVNLWPVKTIYPKAGALLPFNRIVAFYGNLYSKKMGVLGEYPEAEMFAKLDVEVKKWVEADPNTPVIPALHYIAVVAQASLGADGKYRARMPHKEVDKVLAMAEKKNAIVFLDFQVAFSTLDKELPFYEKYFKLPNVHLGIDPEFSMKNGIRPGKVVGTFDAVDANYAINFLAKIVKENNLPPKILVIHRYTQRMLTNYSLIKPLSEVQVVIHMDGWGVKEKKVSTYKQFVYKEPVQFTGFKLFYKNDIWEPGTVMFTPKELMNLNPRPVYIQYQ